MILNLYRDSREVAFKRSAGTGSTIGAEAGPARRQGVEIPRSWTHLFALGIMYVLGDRGQLAKPFATAIAVG
jgi:hypothetical protein